MKSLIKMSWGEVKSQMLPDGDPEKIVDMGMNIMWIIEQTRVDTNNLSMLKNCALAIDRIKAEVVRAQKAIDKKV